MKTNRILTGRFLNRVWSWTIPCLILSLQLPATIRAEEPNEKAERYHSALLRRPSGDYLFDRFFNSWLDTGTIDGLGEFLNQRGDAEDATTADRLLYGYFLVKTGRESEALEIFSKALESDPENEEAWAESAKAHARTLDFETALTEIDKAITLTESDELTIELGKLKGRWQARTGESEEALKTWKTLSDQFPDDDEMKEDLVDLQLGESLIEEALATQKALVESTRDPYHKITRKLRLGDIYLRSGEQEEAKRIYQESLEASGQGTWLEKEILAQFEQLFRREDDIAGLDEFYTNLIETHPQRIALRLRQADVLAERGENEKVVESFQEILKMTPGDRDNREAYVSILGQIDMVEEAVSQMEALCESFPEDPELVTQLAAWQHRAEDREAAQKSVERFLELSDGSEYSYLRAARMLEQFDLAEAAAATFESLIAKFPESTGALDEQAAFLHRNEKVEEAIALWKKIASDGDSQDAIRAARMLSSRGERESAYQILLERAEEFSGDFVFLGRLCTEAIASGHAEEALPWVEKRLTLAESSGDLSEVIRQVNSILRTTEKTEEYRESLRSKIDELSIHEACLLSELLDQNGEYDAATTILEPLIKGGEVLAMNQRVRQLVSRNDWKPAAAEMEKIVNLPEGRRSNDIERLIDLHRRALDFDKALEWIEEWKKISPGASRPWILEANTLYEKGEVDDAILVLRQAANQFEDDDEPRTLLASYFSQQGKHEDAERIYWNLYEESEEVAAKIRWATSLAMAAEANGKVDALLEKFEERRKNNETSIAPLLSIAEIHRRTNNYEGRREALLEATRMRPEDLGLLRQIARIEESEGDWERALKTLETAATLDKTDDTKKRIALLHLRYGDEEEAYQKLFSLAGGSDMEAETVIGMTDAMIARMDWDRALTFIDEHHERFPEDYRIGYLRAVILEEAGDSETAIDAFLQLLDIDQELPSVKKQTSQMRATYASRIEEYYGKMPEGAFEMMTWFNHRYYSYQYRNTLQSRSVRFQSNPLSGISGVVRLPGSLDELRSYTLTHINGVAQFLGEGEDLEQLQSELEARGIADAAILLAVQFGDQHSSQFIVDEMMTERFPESRSLMACFAVQSGRSIRNGQVIASGDFLAT
ncbi:MAG: tetratricopeptide repeat protein, partial [Verrucomicrobiota bacterium]